MFLILEDGAILEGISFAAQTDASGEVVFNTGMVGYPETLTDPSYRGQILVLTYPLIGNYGVVSSSSNLKSQISTCLIGSPPKRRKPQLHVMPTWHGKTQNLLDLPFESEKIQIAGLIVSEYCSQYSHPQAKQSLANWLKSENIPAMEGIDTRALTEKLREKGTMLGIINSKCKIQSSKLQFKIKNFDDPNKKNLAAEVSCREPIIYEPLSHKTHTIKHETKNILLYDCGVKLNIIRSLLNRNCRVIRVPWNQELSIENYELRIMNYEIDGIVISNGPGDPTKCDRTIEQIKKILEIKNLKLEIPVLGICLGNQIMALAAGAKTYKLKYGHRGQNQPVMLTSKLKTQNSTCLIGSPPKRRKPQLKTQNYKNSKQFNNQAIKQSSNRAFITSQNHGFAVDEKTLPNDWQVWFKNLNDGTVEGIRHREKPWMAVQFHPEAAPGPTDTEWIF
ncbi:MAG: glutamine-hydrolyzing carbamoyl-phosphate synthase small subunit, partial [Candidatus Jacksonbacteria bacterium]